MLKKLFIFSIVLGCFFTLCPTLFGKTLEAYDGIWILGFNMHKDIFSDPQVRKAIGKAINRQEILKIMGEEIVPNSFIPPSMTGYNPKSQDFIYDLTDAKSRLIKAGYSINDKRLKKLSLLHTDGDKTIQIAKLLKRNLIQLGINLDLVQVSYQKQNLWQQKLESGKYHMFLLGYKGTPLTLLLGDKSTKLFHKSGCKYIPTEEDQEFFNGFDEALQKGYKPCSHCNPERENLDDPYDLIQSLFHSQEGANFTFYQNPRIDTLLDQLAAMDKNARPERESFFEEINEQLIADPPAVVLFYITRL